MGIRLTPISCSPFVNPSLALGDKRQQNEKKVGSCGQSRVTRVARARALVVETSAVFMLNVF